MTDQIRGRLIDCRRAFHPFPCTRADYGWTESSVEELRAEADRTSQPQPESQPLTHLDKTGAVHMVEISGKAETIRVATAVATLYFSDRKSYDALSSQAIIKGNAVAVARLAAIQAAKKTSDLVPLAHPSLGITAVSVDVDVFGPSSRDYQYHGRYINGTVDTSPLRLWFGGVTLTATVKCEGKTGVEMEAITAATIGAVTMYDMLKAVDKGMVIMGARVIKKEGGKSGGWEWDEVNNKLVKAGEPKSTLSNEQTSQMEGKHSGVFTPQAQALDEKRIEQSRPVITDVDEWNKGLVDEFSVPETTYGDISQSGTEMDSSDNFQTFDSSDSQTSTAARNDESKPEAATYYSESDKSQTDRFAETEETRHGPQSTMTQEESIQPSADSTSTTQTPSTSKTEESDTSPSSPAITLLKQNLLAIQQSKYIQTLANSNDPHRREKQLDTAREWRPHTMTPIVREDLTSDFETVDARDLMASRRRRYEEGGSGGGSVIG